jgi:ATP-binding protein involved in chromosome partitioning
MAVTEDQVWKALKNVPYPGFSRDIVTSGVVRGIQIADGKVRLALTMGSASPDVAAALEESARDAVQSLSGVDTVEVDDVRDTPPASSLNVVQGGAARPQPTAQPEQELVSGVRHVVAVASGKGGVGKSTVAVNLAVALARRGNSVGLLDADIYGPSIPLMMGARDDQPTIDQQAQRLIPLERFGVRFMSLGFLVDPEAAVIWRGPMVMKALEQLLSDVDWSGVDILVVDLPPGTGDAQLTLSQRVRLAGAVIVTTPQDVALADAIKGVAMFRKVGVPVLGVVENMSYFRCPHCSKRTEVFGHGGGREQALRLKVPFLGEVPLDGEIRLSGDNGQPVAAAAEDRAATSAFLELADTVAAALHAGQAQDGKKGWGD